jgi:hypothetical protein
MANQGNQDDRNNPIAGQRCTTGDCDCHEPAANADGPTLELCLRT